MAFGSAKRISQANARLQPAPMQGPSMRATVGTGKSASVVAVSITSSRNDTDSLPSARLSAVKSAPAQNTPLLPWISRTCTSGHTAAAPRWARIASHMAHDSALRFAGRCSSRTATPSVMSNPTCSDSAVAIIRPAFASTRRLRSHPVPPAARSQTRPCPARRAGPRNRRRCVVPWRGRGERHPTQPVC